MEETSTIRRFINALNVNEIQYRDRDSYIDSNLDVLESKINGNSCRGLVYQLKNEKHSTSAPLGQLIARFRENTYFTATTLRGWAKNSWLSRVFDHFSMTHPLTDRFIFLMTFLHTLYCQRRSLPLTIPLHFYIYFKTLPTRSTLYSPMFYSASEFELLKGTAIPFMVDAKYHVLSNEFQALWSSFKDIFEHQFGKGQFIDSTVDLNDYAWLDTIFWSRVIELPHGPLCMVPLMDMANHSSEASNLYWKYCNHTTSLEWFFKKPSSSMVHQDGICPLLLKYATRPHNESLFFVHGFCDPSYLFKKTISIYFGDLFNEEETMGFALNFFHVSPMVQFPSPTMHDGPFTFSSYFNTMPSRSRLCCYLSLLWEHIHLEYIESAFYCFHRLVNDANTIENLISMKLSQQPSLQSLFMDRIQLIVTTALEDLRTVQLPSSTEPFKEVMSVETPSGVMEARSMVVNALAMYRKEIEFTLEYVSQLSTW
ncbi:hypothetical protein HMI55_001982 [Coelomomyces lativittatus]|nr:hypothetical protein HMI55_001982 [Coelomomyces lativittatus]KAJ1510384.1 hypothetical protein HMI56_006363 [Coelomomyces lativittatus]